VSVTASASDNVGVTKVEFYVNGTLSSTATASPYSYNWNTVTVANDSYTLSAKAYDAAGNVGQSSAVTVIVNNQIADTTAPAVSITSPANSATVSGTVVVKATASDNIGVAKVELYIKGVLVATDTASPFSFTWDTTLLTKDSYNLTFKAYDAAGNSSVSSVTVTVYNSGNVRKKRGDLNGDGVINIADALLALKLSVKLTPLSDNLTIDSLDGDVAPLDASDAPLGDGVVNIADALMILKYSVGLVQW